MKLLFNCLQAMLLMMAFVVVEQVLGSSRECVVHKDMSSIQQNLEVAKHKHGNCSLVEFAAFIQSDKMGGFIELKDGHVSNLMSQCLSNNPYSYIYIEFECGVVDFEFVDQGQEGVLMSRLRFGYYGKDNFITYGELKLNQHLKTNQSYECSEDRVYESSAPCIDGTNCNRLHLQHLKVEPFRRSNSSNFIFNNVRNCIHDEMHDLKQD